MKITLITKTENMEQVIATAAKLCYSDKSITEVMEKQIDEEKVGKFIAMLADIGHGSPLEHISFTFGIEGVSRSTMMQVQRHRMASYSQQSQRYVNLKECFDYVIPNEIKEDKEATEIFIHSMNKAHTAYLALSIQLKEKYLEKGLNSFDAEKKAIENARYVLPNATCTNTVMTMNARSLINFFKHRLCNRAQDEIREVAREMFKIVYANAPNVFKGCLPTCAYGKCSEGKMTCKKPLKKSDFIGGKQYVR